MISSVDMAASSARFSSCLCSISRATPYKRDAPVIADDPAAAVSVGKAGQNMRTAAAAHVGGVSIEDAFVVRFAVLAERLDDGGIGLASVRLESRDDHAQPAIGHDRAFQGGVRLQADDDFICAIDIAGSMGDDRAGDLGDIENALAALLQEDVVEAIP